MNYQKPKEAAEIFYQAGVKYVIIKCGKKGCYLYNKDGGFYVPAVEGVTCVDTTGVGATSWCDHIYMQNGKTI